MKKKIHGQMAATIYGPSSCRFNA